MKKRKEILLDRETQEIIRSSFAQIKNLQDRISLICQVYLNSKRASGNYILSSDMKKLLPQKTSGEKK